VYCDTSLISSTLERRFPASAGYGTIFPPRKGGSGKTDAEIIQAFSQHYVERVLFPLAITLLKWENFTPAFIADRSNVTFVYASSAAINAEISSLDSGQDPQLTHKLW
jgi:hypothetical protein